MSSDAPRSAPLPSLLLSQIEPDPRVRSAAALAALALLAAAPLDKWLNGLAGAMNSHPPPLTLRPSLQPHKTHRPTGALPFGAKPFRGNPSVIAGKDGNGAGTWVGGSDGSASALITHPGTLAFKVSKNR